MNQTGYDGFGMRFGGTLSNACEISVETFLGGKERGEQTQYTTARNGN